HRADGGAVRTLEIHQHQNHGEEEQKVQRQAGAPQAQNPALVRRSRADEKNKVSPEEQSGADGDQKCSSEGQSPARERRAMVPASISKAEAEPDSGQK